MICVLVIGALVPVIADATAAMMVLHSITMKKQPVIFICQIEIMLPKYNEISIQKNSCLAQQQPPHQPPPPPATKPQHDAAISATFWCQRRRRNWWNQECQRNAKI